MTDSRAIELSLYPDRITLPGRYTNVDASVVIGPDRAPAPLSDAHPGNIHFLPDGTTGLLDWQHVNRRRYPDDDLTDRQSRYANATAAR